MVPLISLAFWSRAWLGWYALIPIALTFFWVWYNPRAFPPPRSTDNWASKGTFGERIFLTVFSFMGALIWVYGLYALNVWATVAGVIGVVLPKAWFVDRMVWIYEDMKETDPKYAVWLN